MIKTHYNKTHFTTHNFYPLYSNNITKIITHYSTKINTLFSSILILKIIPHFLTKYPQYINKKNILNKVQKMNGKDIEMERIHYNINN